MRPRTHVHSTRLLALAAAAALAGGIAHAAVFGQWDFNNGNLTATIGQDLAYMDGAGGATDTQTVFETVDIGGQPAKVMKFPPCDSTMAMGYLMYTPTAGNGGEGAYLLNQWTLILDLMYPTESDLRYRAIFESDDRITSDSDFFINTSNGIGISAIYHGQVQPNVWHRIAIVIDQSAGANTISKYIDGLLVGVQPAGGLEGRWAPSPNYWVQLFNDDDGDVQTGYVNSIQFHNSALTEQQIAAYGGATAEGIPTTPPAVSSHLEGWIPSGQFATKNTDVGVIINDGDTTIADASIVLKLDGTAVASPQITRGGDRITVRKTGLPAFPVPSKHDLEIQYTDSKDGARTFAHSFDVVVFYESFDGLTLGPNVDETTAGDAVWTSAPPDGWSIDNSGMQGVVDDDGAGVKEWEGWSFAKKDWWVQAAGDQTRSQFVNASGNVAVTDPDEWDDKGSPIPTYGYFNSTMQTSPIDVAGLAPNTLFLNLDTSWRPEGRDDIGPDGLATNDQTAVIAVSYDGGAPIELLRWTSISGDPTFHPDSQNENVTLELKNPAGAASAVLSFSLLNAGNDWWWAIDNVVVNAGQAPPMIITQPASALATRGDIATLSVVATGGDPKTYQWFKRVGADRSPVAGGTAATLTLDPVADADAGFYSVEITNSAGQAASREVRLMVLPPLGALLFAEDFEGLPLGPNADEAVANPNAWTHTPPAGWSIDNAGTPGIGDPAQGVVEWEGWSFANREWWATTAEDQRRAEFTKGTGTAAIADGDEWDDKGDPADLGKMDTSLRTPAISLTGILPNTVVLQFDSSWRPEPDQKASVSVAFDGGAPAVARLFHSDPANADYKDDNSTNDRLSVPINNPEGAQTMVIVFRYFDAGNNWWWAIDNIKVTGGIPPLFHEDFEGLTLGPSVEESQFGEAVWTKTPPAGWTIDDSGVPGAGDPANDGMTEWAGWSFASRDWWPTVDDQRRSEFTQGIGTVAIADSDEYDDAAHPDGTYNTYLKTPDIDIAGREANSLTLRFDSSWRPEPNQKVTITATYDGGAPVEVLRFESVETSPDFKDDNSTNDELVVPLHNPAGAKKVMLTFGYFDADNNWFWAIDNIEILGYESRVPADIALTIQRTETGVSIDWSGDGTLESAPAVKGPWNVVPGASRPYATPASGAAAFYRVKK